MSTKQTDLMPGFTDIPDRFPQFQTEIIGSFSIDKDCNFLPDAQNCQYVSKENSLLESCDFDLNKGVNDIILKPDIAQNEKIDYLLKYIFCNRNSLKIEKNTIVCSRGLLRKLLCTPYNLDDSIVILATKFKGIIYLCTQESKKEATERQQRTPAAAARLRLTLSYGLKFEQFMLTGW